MSETVHYKGIAKKVITPEGKTINEFSAEILKERNIKIDDYYENEMACLADWCYDSYFYHKKSNTLFEITRESHEPNDDIIRAEFDRNGNINYELRYYNGGAGFEECLEEALDKLLKDEEKQKEDLYKLELGNLTKEMYDGMIKVLEEHGFLRQP